MSDLIQTNSQLISPTLAAAFGLPFDSSDRSGIIAQNGGMHLQGPFAPYEQLGLQHPGFGLYPSYLGPAGNYPTIGPLGTQSMALPPPGFPGYSQLGAAFHPAGQPPAAAFSSLMPPRDHATAAGLAMSSMMAGPYNGALFSPWGQAALAPASAQLPQGAAGSAPSQGTQAVPQGIKQAPASGPAPQEAAGPQEALAGGCRPSAPQQLSKLQQQLLRRPPAPAERGSESVPSVAAAAPSAAPAGPLSQAPPQGAGSGKRSVPEEAKRQAGNQHCGDEGADEPQTRATKRPRLVWTPQLHSLFCDAISQLGLKQAVPKTIMQMMDVEGLTRENVASHLQKYRLQLKKEGRLDEEGNILASSSNEPCMKQEAGSPKELRPRSTRERVPGPRTRG